MQRKVHVYDNTHFDHEVIIKSSQLECFFSSILACDHQESYSMQHTKGRYVGQSVGPATTALAGFIQNSFCYTFVWRNRANTEIVMYEERAAVKKRSGGFLQQSVNNLFCFNVPKCCYFENHRRCDFSSSFEKFSMTFFCGR